MRFKSVLRIPLVLHEEKNFFLLRLSMIYFLINFVFIYFGYDLANLGQFVYAGSLTQLGLNPYIFDNTGMVMGYFSQFYYLVAASTYGISSSSVLATYLSIKFIGVLFFYLTSILVYDLLRESGKQPKFLFSLLMLNPWFFFFNDIQMVDTILPLFYMVFGYWTIQRSQLRGKTIYVFIGSFFILASVFILYFTAIIIPSLLIFTKGTRRKITLLIALLIDTTFLLIPMYALQAYTSFSSFLVSVGSRTVIEGSIFSILRIFGQLPSAYFWFLPLLLTISIIVVSVLTPLILYYKGYSVALSISIVLLYGFMIEWSGITPDLYLYTMVFLFLSLPSIKNSQTLKVLSCFIMVSFVPLIIIQEFYWGLDGTTGIFYWLFPLLHIRISIFKLVPNLNLVTDILLSLNVIFYLAILYFIFRHFSTTKPEKMQYKCTKIPTSGSQKSNFKSRGRSKAKILLVWLLAFVIVIVIISASFNLNTGSKVSFPLLQFQTTTESGNFAFQSPNTYSTSSDGNSISISSNSTGIKMYRNLTDQWYAINFQTMEGDKGGMHPGIFPIISSNLFNISFLNTIYPESGSTLMNYSLKSNVSVVPLSIIDSRLSLINGTNWAYSLVGNSYLSFNLNWKTVYNKTIFFSERSAKFSNIQTIVFVMSIHNTTYESTVVNNTLSVSYYHGGIWHSENVHINDFLNTWYPVSMSFGRNSLIINMLGMQFNMPLYYLQNTATVNTSIGKFSFGSQYDYNYSLDGLITPIHLENTSLYSMQPDILTLLSKSNTGYNFINGTNSYNISLNGNTSYTVLQINNESQIIHHTLNFIYIGKLGNFGVSVRYHFGPVFFGTSSMGSQIFLKIILLTTIFLPVFLGVIIYIDKERKTNQ